MRRRGRRRLVDRVGRGGGRGEIGTGGWELTRGRLGRRVAPTGLGGGWPGAVSRGRAAVAVAGSAGPGRAADLVRVGAAAAEERGGLATGALEDGMTLLAGCGAGWPTGCAGPAMAERRLWSARGRRRRSGDKQHGSGQK